MFGFVGAPGLPCWPAKMIGEAGGKFRVTFFGTGQTSLIDRSDWVPYSPLQLKKVDTNRNKRRWGAFRAGLKELRAALELKIDTVEPKTSESKKEQGTKPKAVGLRKEQAENERKFRETIIKVLNKRQWKCTRCKFSTGYKYKARAHAILCNSMLRARKKRNKKYSCLICPNSEVFSSKKLFRMHNKKEHSSEISYICTDHTRPMKFGSRQSFLRHRREKHGLVLNKLPCTDCPKMFIRKHDLKNHIKRIHPKRLIAQEIVNEMINIVIQGNPQIEDNSVIDNETFEISDCGLGNSLNQAGDYLAVGSLCEIEKIRLKRIAEQEKLFREVFKDEYEAREQERLRKLKVAAERKRKMALTKEAIKDQPLRKSPRLKPPVENEDKENEKLVDIDSPETISNHLVDEIIENVIKSKTVAKDTEFADDENMLTIKLGSSKIMKIKLDLSRVTGNYRNVIESNEDESSLEIDLGSTKSEKSVQELKVNKTGNILVKLNSNQIMKLKLDIAKPTQDNNEFNKTDKEHESKFGCSLCGTSFQNNHKLALHKFRMHEAKDPPPICHRTWCNQNFPTKYERDQHTDNCFLTCPVCRKKFKRQDRYSGHQRYETSLSARLNFMR